MGNTNFSIHLPRSAFDRKATAQVVLRAVRALGIDANVNDRNDVCVGKDKICLLSSLATYFESSRLRRSRLRLGVQDRQ